MMLIGKLLNLSCGRLDGFRANAFLCTGRRTRGRRGRCRLVGGSGMGLGSRLFILELACGREDGRCGLDDVSPVLTRRPNCGSMVC